MNNKIKLPENYEPTESFSATYELGDNILEFCDSCTKQQNCKMSYELRCAMGEDYPFWARQFMVVDIATPYQGFHSYDRKAFCADYKNQQLPLPGIEPDYCDGVERLIEIVEKEKKEFIAEEESDFLE